MAGAGSCFDRNDYELLDRFSRQVGRLADEVERLNENLERMNNNEGDPDVDPSEHDCPVPYTCCDDPSVVGRPTTTDVCTNCGTTSPGVER